MTGNRGGKREKGVSSQVWGVSWVTVHPLVTNGCQMKGKQRGRLEGSEDKFCLTLLVTGERFCGRGSQRVGNYFLDSRKDGEQ